MSDPNAPLPREQDGAYTAPGAYGDSQPYEGDWEAPRGYNPPPMRMGAWMPRDTSPLSVGQYLLTILIAVIPLVGLIMLFIWSFRAGENLNRRNLARGILLAVMILCSVGLLLQFALLPAVLWETSRYYY